MPRASAKSRPDRSQELLDVSAALFSERGYDATTMQEIADRMGILKGSLYHYVRTKEDLLWMVIEPSLRALVEGAEAILKESERPIGDRLVAVMRAHAESYEANHPHMSVLTREDGETLSEARRKDLDALRRRYFNLLRQAIVSGQKAGEIRADVTPTIAVHAIFGMLNWMFRWFNPGGRMKARDVAAQFAGVVVSGLVTEHGQALQVPSEPRFARRATASR